MTAEWNVRRFVTVAALVVLGACAQAQTAAAEPEKVQKKEEDLTDLNLDDLANMKVTTASKKAESLFGVGASLSVVTAEDIKRLGANNIPEALRGVPGVQVAQLTAQNYAVSVRGFNGQFSDKLLVLIDGRSIYNTLYGGVYWEDFNMAMEDIERIEVIRGPGGTLWGANAVNGIINVITRGAKDTQGGLVQFEGGKPTDLGTGTFRYGTKMKDGFIRFTGYGVKRGQTFNASGNGAGDDWAGGRFGFRYDGGSDKRKLMVSADYRKFDYDSATISDSLHSYGGHALAKLDLNYANGASDSFQMFFDSTNRFIGGGIPIRNQTVDFDFQHSFATKGQHSLVVGAGARYMDDDYSGGSQLLSDSRRLQGLYSAFIQDEIQLNKKSRLSLGTKVLYNEFSGVEVQPSIRFSTEPDSSHAMWASVTRAVRTPTFSNRRLDVQVPSSPAWIKLNGDENYDSTSLIAAEAGYRVKLSSKATLDTSFFHNSYDKIDGSIVGAPYASTTPVNHLEVPVLFTNVGKATTYGFEVSSKIQATDQWRLDLGYSFLDGSLPSNATLLNAPKHAASLLSTYSLDSKWSFDQSVYFVGKSIDNGSDAYTRFDLQVRYHASKDLEFSFGGRNLGEGNYKQINATTVGSSNFIRPQWYVKATWKF